MSQNMTHLIGNVALVPQMKNYDRADGTQGYRTWFRLAVCRLADRGKPRGEQRTSFISVVCFGNAAQRHAQHIGRGDQISVYGELVVDTREENGKYQEFPCIIARDIQYLRRANKNRTPEDLLADAKRLTDQVKDMQSALQNASQSAPAASVSVPVAASTEGQNPFDANGAAVELD